MTGLEELATRTLLISPKASVPADGAGGGSGSSSWPAEFHGRDEHGISEKSLYTE
ncbi:hypothetical protein KSP40_PGU006182 [Platanthera guangdongensis]|uniref:Photosystem II protein H n=1 Tax=Platanthera guangdongensis TaxID=2320717 RepID=A0ABR2MG79_9ASPA